MGLSLWKQHHPTQKTAPYYLLHLDTSAQTKISYNPAQTIEHVDNYLYHQLDAQIREKDLFRQWLYQNIIPSFHSKTLSKTHRDFLQQWCQIQIEAPGSSWQTQEGYACLINLLPHDAHPFTRLEHLSAAQDHQPNPWFADQIKELILGEDQQEAQALLSHQTYEDDEWETLKILSNHGTQDLRARALYRMALIKRYGRSNATEVANIDLNASIQLQKLALGDTPTHFSNAIHVAFIINEHYVQHAKTAIASMLIHSNFDTFYHIHIITDPHDPLSKSSTQSLNSLHSIKSYQIDFTTVSEATLDEYKNIINLPSHSKRNWPRLIFFKLMIEKILPHLHHIIVLDADTLIKHDLHPLQQHLINSNQPIAAALDPKVTHMTRYRTKDCPHLPPSYINVGVLALDLRKLRTMPTLAMLHQTLEHTCDFFFPEQDLINLALQNHIHHLSQRWNTLPQEHIDDTPWIVHYMGEKPWQNKHSKIKDFIDYQHYKNLSVTLYSIANSNSNIAPP